MTIEALILQQQDLIQSMGTTRDNLADAIESNNQQDINSFKALLAQEQEEYKSISNQVNEARTNASTSIDQLQSLVYPESFGGVDVSGVGSPSLQDQKYSIRDYQYPNDLISNKAYGGNYAMFYINVAVDSKLASNSKDTDFIDDFDQTTRRRGSIVANNLSFNQVQGASTLVGGVKGALGGGLLGGSLFGALKGAGFAGVASTVGFETIKAAGLGGTRAQKRLKTAIALHIPNQLQTRYGVTYSEEDTFEFAAAAEILKATGGKNKFIDAAKAAGSKGLEAGSAIALQKVAQAGAVSAATGLAPNPKKEQVFKGVDFRTFTFEYQFFPRNEDEAKNVQNIIQQFKFHMHPEYKGSGEFIFVYPSEFDIVYYTNGQENENLHRHTSCVLTEMSVNYTPNGAFNTFAQSRTGGGMPTQINIQLTFRELQILTKELVGEGL